LYLKAKRIHWSLPNAYSHDFHLRDFLLRACFAEPFCSKIPEEPAKSSSDALARLSAAITRYAAYKSKPLRARQMGKFSRRSIVERDSKSGIHYAETRSVSSKAVPTRVKRTTLPSLHLVFKERRRTAKIELESKRSFITAPPSSTYYLLVPQRQQQRRYTFVPARNYKVVRRS
jgi:hypothetical protein